jgi:hypothetical protein
MNHHNTLIAMLRYALSVAVVFTLAVTCWADDITGEDDFLCASANVNVCLDDGSCISAVPWEVGVPDFMNVDLKKRRLSTTESSGENRATEIDAIERLNGHIYLHGVDGDRVFSFVIDEMSGFITAAIARDGLTVTVFGSCTPTP